MTLPEPGCGADSIPLEAEVVELSTRIILMTMQMLLITYLKDSHFIVTCLREFPGEKDVHFVLKKLHLEELGDNESQLELFEGA